MQYSNTFHAASIRQEFKYFYPVFVTILHVGLMRPSGLECSTNADSPDAITQTDTGLLYVSRGVPV